MHKYEQNLQYEEQPKQRIFTAKHMSLIAVKYGTSNRLFQ